MGIPFLFPIIALGLVLLVLRYKKLEQNQQEQDHDFWMRERLANTTPAKNIDNLTYITIPLDKFPLNLCPDEEAKSLENQLVELSNHRLLNLTGKTNTELKEEYGVPNFDTMSKIGEDFDTLTVLLNKYAKVLVENQMIDEAIPVLEFAVGIGTDISESYTMLADCYKEKEQLEKLSFLKTQVENSSLVLKNKILNHINPED